MSLLDPISSVLAAIVASGHAALTSLGADPAAGTTWLLSIAAVVFVVRLALLPVVVHGVRLARASGRARPQLQELARRYRDRTDPDSVREYLRERRRISGDHGVSRLGCLPLLVQVPIWLALYHLLASAAAGTAVGALDAGLVASLGGATILGVSLAERGYLGAGWTHLGVVGGIAVVTAVLTFITQRYLVATNTVLADLPEAIARTQQLMPAVSAIGLIVIGGAVPVALLAYWACNGLWTLAQSAVVWRWFPTPGSPAALRRARVQGSA